ncbi:MAG TPA: hypothetical protein VIP80_11575 [Gemmatimonadales bacterium]
MDPEGILAITFIFGGGSLFLLSISPVGKALAERIRHGVQPGHTGGADAEVIAELESLRSDVTELQERVDFAERMLAQKKGERLPAGEES